MASVELSSRDPHVPADQQSLLDTRHEVSNGAPQDQLDARAILDVQSGVRTKSQIRLVMHCSNVPLDSHSCAAARRLTLLQADLFGQQSSVCSDKCCTAACNFGLLGTISPT